MAKTLKGGIIFNSKCCNKVDVRISGELISEIGENIEKEGDELIDVEGCYILPGGIDVHTHFALDIGSTVTADDFYTGTKAALAGGTTTIIDFVNHKRGTTFKESYEHYKDLSENKCFCDYGFHMTISEWNNLLDKEIENIVALGITTFKMYMAYKNILQVEDIEIEKALLRAKSLGLLLSFHCEDGDIVSDNIVDLLKVGKIEPKFHEASRTDSVEVAAIKRLIDISDKVNYPVYIVHLSSKKALEMVRNRRAKGSKIIVETCPQYLLLDKELYNGIPEDSFNGAKYVMSPPLRTRDDREGLWEAINNDEIQVLATDHCSFNYTGQKNLGKKDFSKIPNGAPGVEHRMTLGYSYGVLENRITINKFVEITAENPSKIFGLFPMKGIIQVGSYADILVIKPIDNRYISFKNQLQNVDYTPYEGFKDNLFIIKLYLRGNEVVNEGEVLIEKPGGRFIKRNIFSNYVGTLPEN